jgi:hypothetical protein
MPYKDREDRLAANRRWYAAHRKDQMTRVKKQGRKIRTAVQQYKEKTPCADCGKCFPHYVMDFDHVRGEKIGNVADIINRNCSGGVWDEIAKCELVCANCHRFRTHARRIALAARKRTG